MQFLDLEQLSFEVLDLVEGEEGHDEDQDEGEEGLGHDIAGGSRFVPLSDSPTALSDGHDLAEDQEKDVGEGGDGVVEIDLFSWCFGWVRRVHHFLGEWPGTGLCDQGSSCSNESNEDQDAGSAIDPGFVFFDV